MAESIEIPENIKYLIGRCEIGEVSFSNDDMSAALKFAEMLWRRLGKMAEHYDGISSCAATDMRHVLRDTAKDCSEVECG